MRGLGLIIHGPPGIGKTSFALQFPKPLKCLSLHEAGYDDLELIDEVPEGCTNINCEDYNEFLRELQSGDAPTKVVDSTSGLQQLLFDHVCEKEYGGDFDAFLAYYKGPRMSCPRYVAKLETVLENLRRQGTNVIFLSHSKVETVRNPDGLDYNSISLDIDEGIRSTLIKWSQSILYMTMSTFEERITKEKGGKAIEAKMSNEDRRVIRCSQSLTYTSKNKLKLPPLIPMGANAQETFARFRSKLPQSLQQVLN